MAKKINIDSLNPKHHIIIKGAKVNNLKNLSVAFPRNKLTVVTGLSGSGKSSLVFDTLFAEGQRRYVESLSAYARQFLARMEKPQVDYIKGVSPAIAIGQKTNTKNPRSTVGTSTEIYDYLKLLFARIGKTISPQSGNVVKKDSVSDVVDYIHRFNEGDKFSILAPLKIKEHRTVQDELKILLQKGYSRVALNGEIHFIEDILENQIRNPIPSTRDEIRNPKFKTNSKSQSVQSSRVLGTAITDLIHNHYLEKGTLIFIVIDRNLVKKNDEDNKFRIADSVQTAFFEGEGECILELSLTNDDLKNSKGDNSKTVNFSNLFESDGILFEEPSVNLFSFNNPYGACKKCEGFGKILGVDTDLVIPDKSLSVYDAAIAPWRSEKMGAWLKPLISNSVNFNFPIHRPYNDLTDKEKELLWTGNEHFRGLNDFFKYIERKTYKIQYRVLLSRYRGKTTCPDCKGTRLREDASYVKIAGKSITDLLLLPVSSIAAPKKPAESENQRIGDRENQTKLTDSPTHRFSGSEGKGGGVGGVLEFFESTKFNDHENKIARRLLTEIKYRLSYLKNVGLGYLTLNRLTSTLSGGEFQRIKLATSLGSALVGSMYILDEPTIGLHPRDTTQLTGVLESLRDLGNTVIVVEHDELIMKAADRIIDIGPDAGSNGGKLVFEGAFDELVNNGSTYTAKYLSGKDKIEVPGLRRKWKDHIAIKGASENNLKNIDIKIPIGVICVITGVSGSGKSTLVKQILYPALLKSNSSNGYRAIGKDEHTGKFEKIEGALEYISQVEFVDQNPIGKSSRSNPVTHIKAYDLIRQLYTDQPLSKARSYKPAHFSFNVDGGRCDTCQGAGTVTIEMQFLADINLTCESCKGKRFKQEILDVRYASSSSPPLTPSPLESEKRGIGETESSKTKRFTDSARNIVGADLGEAGGGGNISEVLDMTVDDALIFFKDKPNIINALIPLQKVGLGYICLGQPSNTLSGGEAQRVKLASFLGKGSPHSPPTSPPASPPNSPPKSPRRGDFTTPIAKGKSDGKVLPSTRDGVGGALFFIFDEPTTGLHTHDIKKLLISMVALVEQGHSVVIIEHNMEVVKCADWIIDLGPEGGEKGGRVCFAGVPEDLIKVKNNHTARYLREKMMHSV